MGVVETLYLSFRGAVGFSLIVVGVSFLFGPTKSRATRALGFLFPSVGSLFCLSAIDPVVPLPDEVGNVLVIALVYGVSQALFELTLFLFGDARVEKHRRRVHQLGALLSLAVWALPLLDEAFGWRTWGTSVEDGRSLGPLHTLLGPIIYFWPLVVTILSIQMGRWKLRDLPLEDPGLRRLLQGMSALVVLFVVLLITLALGWEGPYRLAQTALEILMLTWYFHVNRHPDQFDLVREDIFLRHERNKKQEASELEILSARLTQVVADDILLRRPRLTLLSLSAKVGVPAYLLSDYFNRHLGTSFPEWLNGHRIAWVCHRILNDSDAKILDIAFEAGYSSKSTFNLQFAKIVGTSPSDYRGSRIQQLRKSVDP